MLASSLSEARLVEIVVRVSGGVSWVRFSGLLLYEIPSDHRHHFLPATTLLQWPVREFGW